MNKEFTLKNVIKKKEYREAMKKAVTEAKYQAFVRKI